MKNKYDFTKVKKAYQETRSYSLKESGWEALLPLLEEEKIKPHHGFFSLFNHPRSIVFSLCLLLLTGLGVQAVHAALPGDKLYPMKKAAQHVFFRAIGKPEKAVEERARDVIEAHEKKTDENQKKQSVKEYKDAVRQTQKDTQESEKLKQLHKTLQEQEKAFQKLQEKQKDIHLEDAIKTAEDAQKEAKQSPVPDGTGQSPASNGAGQSEEEKSGKEVKDILEDNSGKGSND